jgi:hypothetical protein
MKKLVRLSAMIICAAMVLSGCQAVTARINRRAEAHVKYLASRFIKCDEDKLLAECAAAYRSGECYEYVVRGCNTAAGYRNISGNGWTVGQ